MNAQTKAIWTEQDEAEWNAAFQDNPTPCERKDKGRFSDGPIYFALLILAIVFNFASILMILFGQ